MDFPPECLGCFGSAVASESVLLTKFDELGPFGSRLRKTVNMRMAHGQQFVSPLTASVSRRLQTRKLISVRIRILSLTK